jgi:hypothetical protein
LSSEAVLNYKRARWPLSDPQLELSLIHKSLKYRHLFKESSHRMGGSPTFLRTGWQSSSTPAIKVLILLEKDFTTLLSFFDDSIVLGSYLLQKKKILEEYFTHVSLRKHPHIRARISHLSIVPLQQIAYCSIPTNSPHSKKERMSALSCDDLVSGRRN